MAWSMPWTIVDSLKNIGDNLQNGYNFGDIVKGWYGFSDKDKEDPLDSSVKILGEVLNDSRNEFLEDRAHTEMREDTAYQRAVADMRASGLNPYTIGANPSSSSVSKANENTMFAKLQVVGTVLDLQNLNLKNKSLANQILGTVLRSYLRK